MKRKKKSPFWFYPEIIQCPFCSLDIRAAQNPEEVVRCST